MPIDVNVPVTADDIERWKNTIEDESLEFKTAERNFSSEKLLRYCCALANEGGGRIVFGMAPERPRRIVGTTEFAELDRTRARVLREVGVQVRADEIAHPDISRSGARVVVFSVASRPKGSPVEYRGEYLARRGEELVALSPERLRGIFDEAAQDFSAQVCPGATVEHLDTGAIETLRRLWHAKSGNGLLLGLSHEQLLRDAELVDEDGVTYAALLLLGTPRALSKYLAQAEVIWEYRVNEASIGHDKRQEFRAGFLVFQDEIWKAVNERNYAQPVQRGFVMIDVPPFNERATREAIANAVIHRDYKRQESVFVRQTARTLFVSSPGGLPLGVTVQNILSTQSARNRRMAEVAQKCGLIERSGQGVDLMFRAAILESKELPDFSQTSATSVQLTLHGDVKDPRFLLFIEQAGNALMEQLSIQDYLILDAVNRNLRLSADFKVRAEALRERGLLEKSGQGRGRRFILSRALCEAGGEPGTYTRQRGLDTAMQKELLLRHLQSRSNGASLDEMRQVLKGVPDRRVKYLLAQLKKENRAHTIGSTNAARWFFGPQP